MIIKPRYYIEEAKREERRKILIFVFVFVLVRSWKNGEWWRRVWRWEPEDRLRVQGGANR